jgi:hypothetical protein
VARLLLLLLLLLCINERARCRERVVTMSHPRMPFQETEETDEEGDEGHRKQAG